MINTEIVNLCENTPNTQHKPPEVVDPTVILAWEFRVLTATGVDANNGLYPLAFAICEGKNAASWRWFLRHLKFFMTGDQSICLISDCFPWLKEIVADDHTHRWCLRCHAPTSKLRSGLANRSATYTKNPA